MNTPGNIEVWDLKVGSGEVTKSGDTLELRFQAANSLADLDSGVLLQSNWNPGAPAVQATLGAGQLRTAIDRGLTGIPVGTNRRFLIPAGIWEDTRDLLIVGIDVGAIIQAPTTTQSNWAFDKLSCAIPHTDLERSAQLDLEFCELLDALLTPTRKGKQDDILRLHVPGRLHLHLLEILDERGLAAEMQYKVNYIESQPGDDFEVEIGLKDAETLQRLLDCGDGQ